MWIAGCPRPRCCIPTATPSTSRSRTNASWACAAGPATGSIAAAWIRRICTAGRAPHPRIASPRPLIRVEGQLVACGWDEAMDRITAAHQRITRFLGARLDRVLHQRSAVPRGVLHPGGPARAGIGTNHLDGNTRLCTATAAESAEGIVRLRRATRLVHRHRSCRRHRPVRPQRRGDPDACCGCRILDRLAGPEPPGCCASTRGRPRWPGMPPSISLRIPGTNMALMNALLHELIAQRLHRPRLHRRAHRRASTNSPRSWPTARPSGPPPSAAAGVRDIRGRPRTPRHRPSACCPRCCRASTSPTRRPPRPCRSTTFICCAACSAGPDAGVLQMNGQPTAQNTRECGANGDLPGFRNWANASPCRRAGPAVEREPRQIPHYGAADPRHADLPLRRAGLDRMLWISGTNPAVSLPELARIRRSWPSDGLFVVVQDLFLTETAALADVVLPAAAWGEKTGHVHQRRPHRPPFRQGGRTARRGEVRPGHLPGLRPPHGLSRQGRRTRCSPWDDAEAAFEAWKRCSAGRPCDYTGIDLRAVALRQRRAMALQRGASRRDTDRLYADGISFAASRCLRDLRQGPGDRRTVEHEVNTAR